HLFPTHELSLWLAALRANPGPRELSPVEIETLPPERRGEGVAAVCDALEGGPLTREELRASLRHCLGAGAPGEGFPAFAGHWPRWQLALGPAALEGRIAFGPNRGNRVTYVRLDRWIGTLETVDGDAALREVCRRYLAAYGPATSA